MQRRKFIKNSCISCAGLAFSGLFLQGCNVVKYVATSQVEEYKLGIKKSDFMIMKNDKVSYHQWVLIKSEQTPFPVGVFRFEENKYSALYLECTHQGCEVAPQGNHLQCPCHGSEFSNMGVVQQGPAELDLKVFEIETDQENIYILFK